MLAGWVSACTCVSKWKVKSGAIIDRLARARKKRTPFLCSLRPPQSVVYSTISAVAKKPKKRSSDGCQCRPIFNFFAGGRITVRQKEKHRAGRICFVFCCSLVACWVLGCRFNSRWKGTRTQEAIESRHCIHSFSTGEEKSNQINPKIDIGIGIIIILNLVSNKSTRCTFKTLQKFRRFLHFKNTSEQISNNVNTFKK